MSESILLIQFRTDQSREQEQRCVKETIGSHNINRLKIVSGVEDDLSPDLLDNVSHVILGGSGEFFLGEGAGEGTWLPKIFAFIDEIYKRDVPVFGICFGHQLLLKHAGAQIERIPEMKELGTLAEFLQPAASADPIFKDFPTQFDAILAHQETPVNIPDNIQLLVSSQRVVASGVRIAERRAWGVMFHPDMNMASIRERFAMFPNYADNPDKFQEALGSFKDAPVAQLTIKNFLEI